MIIPSPCEHVWFSEGAWRYTQKAAVRRWNNEMAGMFCEVCGVKVPETPAEPLSESDAEFIKELNRQERTRLREILLFDESEPPVTHPFCRKIVRLREIVARCGPDILKEFV